MDQTLASNTREPIKCVSLNCRPCQAIPTTTDINSNENLIYLVSVNKCDENCNLFDDLYAQLCVPNEKSM